MDKELKGAIIELIITTIILIVAIPVCVNASNRYKEQKELLLNAFETTIDVNNKGDIKEISIYSNNNKTIEVKLGMMITNFYDDYYVVIDNKTYDLRELDYKEDGENKYFILGTYKIDEVKKIEFVLKPKNQSYFKENLIYSFYTEGTLENGRL